MSRALFIEKLKEGLADLPQPQIEEIASDYEFHFAEAAAAGRSEEDIAARLGDPARLARELCRGLEGRPADAAQTPPPGAAASGATVLARTHGRLGWLLAFLILIGMALFYYAVRQNRGDASAPGTAPAAASRQQAPAAPGAKIMVTAGEVLDLGTILQDHIEIAVDGGGHVTAKGRVKELTVHIDGSGSVDFGALRADIVHADISGTGNADLLGVAVCDITISGSGLVRLKVKPKLLEQSIIGSGRIILPN